MSESACTTVHGRRLGRCARAAYAGRSYVTYGAYGLFAVMVILLACLPTGVSTTRQTISSYAHSPQSSLLGLAFCALAVGSALVAYEFWRAIAGFWGGLIAVLIGVWVVGDLVDTVVHVNPVGRQTAQGTVHEVVAVVAFSAVAGTVLAFLGWLVHRPAPRRNQAIAVWLSVWALTTIVAELSVTAASATAVSGSAERLFFASALVWMVTARRTVGLTEPRAPH